MHGPRLDAALLDSAQREQQQLAAFHLERGRRLFEHEQNRDALTELRKAIYLSPYEAEPHLLHRPHLSADGPPARGDRRAERRRLEPREAEGRLALAEALLQSEDKAAARDRGRRGPWSSIRPQPRLKLCSLGSINGKDRPTRELRAPTLPARRRVTRSRDRMTSDVRAALEADEDGFHEIQLNGKQLVFLGMTTTLVSVVIFLCGVLVGRGVKPVEPWPKPRGRRPPTRRRPPRSRPARSPRRPPAPPAAPPRAARRRPPPRPPPAADSAAGRRHRADAARRRSRSRRGAADEPAPVDELSYYDALSKARRRLAPRSPAPGRSRAGRSADARAASRRRAGPPPRRRRRGRRRSRPPSPPPRPRSPPPRRRDQRRRDCRAGRRASRAAPTRSRSLRAAQRQGLRRLCADARPARQAGLQGPRRQLRQHRRSRSASAAGSRQEEKLQPWVIR